MTRKTFNEWKHLVEKQIANGLSVPQFCLQHQLNPKYFYTRKAMVAKARDNTDFIHAQIVSKHMVNTRFNI